MASATKWFSNTGLRLSLGGLSKSKPRSRSSNSSTSPMSSSPSTPKPITREDELGEVFRRFDGNGDGKISAYELRSFFGSVGENLTHEEAEEVIHELDSDGDNLLDMEDFVKMMKKEEEDDDDEDLKKAFEMFEWEKGSGCITPKGLQRMLHRLGDDTSYDECVAMINAFDVDRNGVLDFNEFLQMMA